jgi:cell division protein FtsA
LSTKSKKPIFALDLGTTKFCLGALKVSPNIHYETVSVAASGMRRGMLVDLKKAEEAIHLLLDAASKQLGVEPTQVCVGIAGSHLSGRCVSTSMQLLGANVSIEHINTMLGYVESNFKQEAREILHVIPISYTLDHRPPMDDPIGFSGQTLSASYFLVEGDVNYLKDIVTLCNQCGLEVRRFFAEPVASATVTADEEKKQLGALVCDIGGGTTDCLMYVGGKPRFLFTINIAGHLMTHDLAAGLGVSTEEAEHLKISTPLLLEEKHQELTAIGSDQVPILFSNQKARTILLSRIVEFAKHLRKNIEPLRVALGGGIILTGGASQVSGLPEVLRHILKIPVEIALPQFIDEQAGFYSTNNPAKLATVIGMLALEYESSMRLPWGKKPEKATYWNSFMNWLRELS